MDLNPNPEPVPSWWSPLAWAVVLPSAMCAAGVVFLPASRPMAGIFFIAWLFATVLGTGLGSLAQLKRLFRTRMPTMQVALVVACFAVACLAIQAGLAVWVASRIPPTSSPAPTP
jgi:hypothetical protein